jgi:hypothetical protein
MTDAPMLLCGYLCLADGTVHDERRKPFLRHCSVFFSG